ncbi:3-phytase precursor [Apiospora rasikravindrae]|uniref:3-phytase n=1 Tax=Apiospora rasikravindrae TaxID=990691 RepID=A0ABR1TDQ7_9PEZI
MAPTVSCSATTAAPSLSGEQQKHQLKERAHQKPAAPERAGPCHNHRSTESSICQEGLGVFSLNDTLATFIAAAEPNNVDVVYGFQAGTGSIDLAYAAYRADNTLLQRAIELVLTPTSRSRKTGKQYLFVNAKTAEYLQFEHRGSTTRCTQLVKTFTRGQVEGYVSDAVQISKVGDGHTYGDVEGVTLVDGPTNTQGSILFSQQGVSAYNVDLRAPPHEFVERATIAEDVEKGAGAVSNTDGIAAVGTALGARYPYGLVLVHDDTNEPLEAVPTTKPTSNS